MSQMTFDIDQLLRAVEREALPTWEGMPIFQYTTRYYSVAEHEAMFARRNRDRHGRLHRRTGLERPPFPGRLHHWHDRVGTRDRDSEFLR